VAGRLPIGVVGQPLLREGWGFVCFFFLKKIKNDSVFFIFKIKSILIGITIPLIF
jgi:hypothetical protein